VKGSSLSVYVIITAGKQQSDEQSEQQSEKPSFLDDLGVPLSQYGTSNPGAMADTVLEYQTLHENPTASVHVTTLTSHGKTY